MYKKVNLIKAVIFFTVVVFMFKGNKSLGETKWDNGVVLASIFQPHMVLQANQKINVWGTAKPSAHFDVTLGDKTLKASADNNGDWKVTFSPLEASFDAYRLNVDGLILQDILIGEVWICSGQSNMVRNLDYIDGGKEEYKTSNKNAIRLLKYDGPPLVAKNGYSEADLKRSNTKDFFQGTWTINDEASALKFSAVGWLFGKRLNEQLNTPIGLIQLAVGGSAINNWISPNSLKADPKFAELFTKDWLTNDDVDRGHRNRGKEAFKGVLPEKAEPYLVGQTKYRWMCEPGFLFEAGIAPLKYLNFKGVLWYQGETDAITENSVNRYQKLFLLMVKDWRVFFDKSDLPFIYVQLPSFNKDTWPAFREIQRSALKQIPNSFMAITLDTGNPDNVHPTDKIPVGNRVSYLALNQVYQIKDKKPINLQVEEIIKDKRGLVIRLNQNLGKDTPEIISGFETIDENNRATAVNALKLSDEKILIETNGSAKALRYLWLPNAKSTLKLFSVDGMPLGPFLEEIK